MHESRHRHALNRIRGEGGKFDSGVQRSDEEDEASSTTSSIHNNSRNRNVNNHNNVMLVPINGACHK